jgi:hypothetical protein
LQQRDIKALVEDRSPLNVGSTIYEPHFECHDGGEMLAAQPLLAFIEDYFPAFDRRIAVVGEGEKATEVVFEASYEGIDDPSHRRARMYLLRSLAPLDGVLRVRSLWREGAKLWIHAIEEDFDPTRAKAVLSGENFVYSRGEKTYTQANPFVLEGELHKLDPAVVGEED